MATIANTDIKIAAPVINNIRGKTSYGNYSIPILQVHTFDDGSTQNVNSSKYFWTKKEAKLWLDQNKHLIIC